MAGAGDHRSFEVIGTDGTIMVWPEASPPRMRVHMRKPQGTYTAGWQDINLPPQPRFVGDFKELARAIKSGQPLKLSYDHELLLHETLLARLGRDELRGTSMSELILTANGRQSSDDSAAGMIRGSAANSAVTVGLIGAGSRGTYVTGLVAKNTPARVVALCDVVDGKSEKAAKTIGVENPQLYKDYHQLLASDVDAVIIATPVFLHAEHFEAAVKAGKHIYIEKPASADVEGCKRIMRAADAADRKLHITFGFQRRYGQVYQKAKQLADSGAHRSDSTWARALHQERRRMDGGGEAAAAQNAKWRRLRPGTAGRIFPAI